ncbi:MAG: DUF1385 domain-containing protein, partial [Clostridiales Family XIII bacterium]|nr:DUF1385 domain-containing protein [Clostridiales Family XIII bacterium]
MDFSKIFIKDACPTKIGGQAVLEGIMMKGEDRTAVVCRLEDGRLHIKTELLTEPGAATKIPVVRGVVNFASMLVLGMKTLMYSAEVLEKYSMTEEDGKEPESGMNMNFVLIASVLIALAFVVGVFIIVPTVAVNWFDHFTTNAVALNLFEGVLRIALFIAYIAAISRMKDIRTTFEYHGAEHETIHCFESGLPLTPDNADSFETL